MSEYKYISTRKALDISKRCEELALMIEKNAPNSVHELRKFAQSFDLEFPMARDGKRVFERAYGGAIAVLTLESVMSLYALGMNGQAVVELYGIVESAAVRGVSTMLGHPSRKRMDVIDQLLHRLGLRDLAPVLERLNVWDSSDVKFVRGRFTELRNGIAHRNEERIWRIMYPRNRSMPDLVRVLAEIDPVPLILKAIRLLIKLWNAEYKVVKRHTVRSLPMKGKSSQSK